MRSQDANHALVDLWSAFPPGTPVVVTKDRGEELRTRTASPPWLLGGGTPVIKVEGISGGYSLTRVRLDGERLALPLALPATIG